MLTIVVGAGFGGLAAALRLRKLGHKVTILEANEQPGGRAQFFQKDGFSFDAGPTVITAPYLLEELFQLFGEQSKDYFELVPVDPFYRILFPDGTSFDYVGEEEKLIEEIQKFSPSDVDGYRKLAAHVQKIFNVGYAQLADTPFERLSDMFRVVPDMVRLESYRSVYSLVSKYIKDPKLRQVFTFQPLLVGGNPFNTTSIYLLIHWLERKWGVHFAKGGTKAIVDGLIKLSKKVGIELEFNSCVEEILAENGAITGLRVKKGKVYKCDSVVWNGDPIKAYSNIDQGFIKKHTPAKLQKLSSSMSLFVAYFGTNRKYLDLKHHTIVLGPRYQGLLDDIFTNKKLSEDFSLYLHAPARTDPSAAPMNCDSFYVLAPVPNNASGLDWKQMGETYFKKIIVELEKRCMPDLRKHLVTQFFITPDHFEHNLHSHLGAGFGLEPKLTQSAYFRFHNRSEDIKNLYFVGASTHPGAGVPGVLCSAKVLEKVISNA